MFKKSINNEKWLGKILVIAIFITLVLILTLCTKKTTSPDEKLLAPSNLQITLVENNKIQISWQDNSTNEIKFILDRKKGLENWFEKYNEVAANITTFNDIIPTNSDTIYSYRIRAFDGEDYSEYSIPSAWFAECTKPTNLQLEQIAQDSIKLTWQDNSIGELNFRIDKKIGNANWQENYKLLEPDTTSYIDYNISLYDTCYYRVYAKSGNSNSNYSQNYFIPFLPTPSNLQIEPLFATSVKLTWHDNCEGEDGFLVYKKEESSDWDSISVPANTEEWTDENVIPGIVNYYKVCAYIGDDHSGYIESNINTFPSPSNLVATVVDENKIKLDWIDNNYFEEGFKIERKIYGEDYELLTTVNSNDTSFTDLNVENLVKYYYKIFAYSQLYQSVYSNEVNAICSMGYILIPVEYSTIQSGMNEANNGDTVLVEPGTYIENIIFNGKNITLASLFLTTSDTNFIYQTIIDGNNNGRVVEFSNCVSSNVFITGFIIQNGYAYGNSGGGIYCNNSSPQISNSIIRNNRAYAGGGMCCWNNSNAILSNVIIQNNDSHDGGGILCNDSNIILSNVIVTDNTCNTYEGKGGGIYIYSSNPSFENVIVSNNAGESGGGICIYNHSNPSLVNVLIINNLATGVNGIGGGIYCDYYSSPSLVNVTISYNTAQSSYNLDGGIHSSYHSCPNLLNCILWNNSPNEIFLCSTSNIILNYSNIDGGWVGEGNINVEPLFVDPNTDDFHLQPDSPCIDVGNPDPQYNDYDGTRNDMGAYGGPGGDW